MSRILKIALILSVAVWALLGVTGNITDWAGTTGAVSATTSMATFEGAAEPWRATTSPAIVLGGAIFIVLGKALCSALCFTGAYRMWKARGLAAADFAASKKLALSGCGVAVLMLFSGWIIIAETWFELWRSYALRDAALGSAFRYAGIIGLIALLVGAAED
ncbi:DUF2165 family protein [Altererythrobacter aquiaggeris]|uniref:DUF2165 family protein n=1 Tax=Aestuarierythrobacter aquiaggeris TaxID=1898396 RepID=UPI003017A03C